MTGIGMSGSGKTTFVRELVPRMIRWFQVPAIIWDTKGQGEYDDMATVLSTSQHPPSIPEQGILVWKPPLDSQNDYDDFAGTILKRRRPIINIFDELSNLGRGSPDSYVPNYALLMKQGRGLKIFVGSFVQEAAAIPRQTIGQTSHVFRFHLLNEYDRLKMARMMGLPESQKYLEPPYPFGFFYRRVDKPSPVYAYLNWQQFFGVTK